MPPRKSRSDQVLEEKRHLFSFWGDPDVEEEVDGDCYSYYCKGEPFIVLEREGDEFHVQYRVAKVVEDWLKNFRSRYINYKRLEEDPNWVEVRIGLNQTDWLEAGVGGNVGAMKRELTEASPKNEEEEA